MTSALEKSSENLLEIERRRALRRDMQKSIHPRITRHSRLDFDDNFPDWY